MNSIVQTKCFLIRTIFMRRVMSSGEPGCGAGQGGGDGGSIRRAGGAFGKMEAARENEYFHKKTQQQLSTLKKHLCSEIQNHLEDIKRSENAIKRHKEHLEGLKKK